MFVLLSQVIGRDVSISSSKFLCSTCCDALNKIDGFNTSAKQLQQQLLVKLILKFYIINILIIFNVFIYLFIIHLYILSISIYCCVWNFFTKYTNLKYLNCIGLTSNVLEIWLTCTLALHCFGVKKKSIHFGMDYLPLYILICF